MAARAPNARHPSLPSHPDYGFEYSDEDIQDGDADVENAYYNSKGGLRWDGAGERGGRDRRPPSPLIHQACSRPTTRPPRWPAFKRW
jgi:hypothetical protein